MACGLHNRVARLITLASGQLHANIRLILNRSNDGATRNVGGFQPVAFSCSAQSCLIPPSASANRASNSAREKPRFSPVA